MRSSKPIRWGILGTGWVAQHFMADLTGLEGAALVAVGSRSVDRAEAIAKRFGAARAHGSYESLASDPDVDVVYVATEHHEHAEHCLLALREGKHVLCEKPFTTSVESAHRVIEEARRRGLFCMEAMWTRFLPATLEAKRLVDAGRIGMARLLTADFGAPVVEAGPSRFFDPNRGGGALLDRGVYAISLAVWLFGKPTEVVALAHASTAGVDDTMSAILKFTEGRIAVLSASLGVLSGNEAVVGGSAGRLRLHAPLFRPERVSIDPAPATAAGPRADLRPGSARERARRLVARARPYFPLDGLRSTVLRHPVHGYGYRYEAAEVGRCIREGLQESPTMPLDETLTIVGTTERIRARFSAGGA